MALTSLSLLKLTHANSNKEVFINAPVLFGCYFMQEHKSTVVIAIGGAMIPVKESVEEVLQMWEVKTNEPKEEKKEGE